ncbi:hypothetical protein BH09VER1_BH09VER1_03330 [soil metagenome]
MKRRLCVTALGLLAAGAAWGLDTDGQRLADRYRSILANSPGQVLAFDRLWKIYATAGETEVLVNEARQQTGQNATLSGRILLRAGQKDEAAQVWREAAAHGDGPAADFLANLLEADGKAAEAAGVLEALKSEQKNAGVLMRLGALWQTAGQADKARAAWERAVALAPDDLALRKKVAAACLHAGDNETALVHFKVIAEKGTASERLDALDKITSIAEANRNWNEAVASQEAMLALMGPDYWNLANARRRLFRLRQQAGTLDELEQQWSAQARNHPDDPTEHLRMAALYEYLGQDAKRLAEVHKAAELVPRDMKLAREQAALELAGGAPEAAAATYDKILALHPDDTDAIFLRAEVSALTGKEAEAETRIEEFLASHKDDETAEHRARDFYKRLRLTAPLERRLAADFKEHPDNEAAATELARFYLDEHRFKEAAASLSSFNETHRSPKDAAARAARFASLLQEAKLTSDALTWARKAAEADDAYVLQLADLLEATKDLKGEREVLERVCNAATNKLPREDLDRRLYANLQAQDKMTGSSLDPDKSVREMLVALGEQATGKKTEAAWARLARWQRWNGDKSGAVATARAGLAQLRNSTLLLEMLAESLAEGGETQPSIEIFEQLKESLPERKLEFQRRIGHLKLDSGDLEGGTKIFEALATERPNDWQATSDLALAEQANGNWFQAFDTWRSAYRLAPADARRGLEQSILNVAGRLEFHEQALSFLEEAASLEPDKNVRDELLKQAASLAVRNHLADTWGTRLSNHIKSAPTDLRWKDGLAFLLHEEGRGDEAMASLGNAMPASEESPEVLQAKAKAAEESRDWDEAAKLVKRLIGLSTTPNPQLTMRYANDLEKAGQDEEARTAWEGGVARFARDPAMLTAAAGYFERTGDDKRMEDCYRAAARLGGSPPQVLLRLGKIALERGDRAQALEDFQAVLRAIRPETATFEDCLPLPDRILKSTGKPAILLTPGGWRPAAGHAMPWRRNDEETPEGCRLATIRLASQLLANSPDKKKWLAGFPDKIEKAWALYYAGETEAAYQVMLGPPGGKDAPAQIVQTVAALALESDDGEWLGHWAQSDFDQADDRWNAILAGMSRMLNANWRPNAEALEKLFQSSPALKQWEGCQLLAKANLYQAASQVGRRVAERLPNAQATEAWLRLAEWQIALRELDQAVSSLDRAVDTAVPSCAYNDPLFSAIRARWLLTREQERPAYEQKLAGQIRALKHEGCEASALALIAALKGDHTQATKQIGALFSYLGPFPTDGWTEATQTGGAQLESWNLPRLARDLYRGSIAPGTLGAIGGGPTFQRAMEQLLIGNQLAFAKTPGTRLYFLNGWLTPTVGDEELVKLTTRFQQAGRDETAAAVFQVLCERNPRTEMGCAFIASLADYPLLRETAKGYLQRLMAESHPPLRPGTMEGAGVRLAILLDQDGEYEQELALLNRLRKDDPTGKAVVLQLLPLLGKMGKHHEALALMQSTVASGMPFPELVIPYAELTAAFGREPEAMAMLAAEARRSDSPNRVAAASRLKSMAREVGDSAREQEAAKLLPPEPPKAKTPRNPADWKKMVSELDHETGGAEERFRAGRALVETQPDLPEDLRKAESKRLKKMAEKDPALLPEYYVMRKAVAEREGTTAALEKEMRAEWNEGRGSEFAGEILAQLLLTENRQDDLNTFFSEYLTDRHFNEVAWALMGQKLLNAGQSALAARVYEALNKEAPGNGQRIYAQMQALTKCGKGAEVAPLLDAAEQLAALDPAQRIELARYYLEVGEIEKAQGHLSSAVENPALVDTAAPIWMRLAAEAVKVKQWEMAGEAIKQAARYPQALGSGPLAGYYLGRPGADPRENEFHLPARQMRDVYFEMAHRLLAAKENDRAWAWIESLPAGDPRWRTLLQSVEADDWERAAKLWDTAAAQSPLWDVKAGAAEFYQRRAATRATSAAKLKDLARAHALLPGSFAIADAYATELTLAKKYPAAKKALQEVIEACTQPTERSAAREKLKALPTLSGLPQAG